MAGKSNIEWTEQSWNPIAGCSILTAGCSKCYAMRMAARLEAMGQELYAGLTKPSNAGPVWTGVVRMAPDHVLLAPLKRKKPTTYFVNSMSDLFHEDVPDEWIDRIGAVMAATPWHTYQVLTKRAARMLNYFSDPQVGHRITRHWLTLVGFGQSFNLPLSNVWLGVSTERQQEADERIPLLLQTPAAIRFISYEPALGPLVLHPTWLQCPACKSRGYYLPTFAANHFVPCEECLKWARAGGLTILPGQQATPGPRIDWAIVGGESGHGAREFNLQWARDIVAQCKATGTRCFVKQLGARVVGPHENGTNLTSYKLKSKKGGDPAEWPTDLRVREMPRIAV